MSSLLASARELEQTINNLHVSRFTSVAAATLALYDWLLMFEQERDIMYRSRWSIAKVLFIFVRFITAPGVIIGAMRPVSKQSCASAILFLTYGMAASTFASNGLFTLRLVALYKTKRYMVWFIITFYLATYAATFGLIIASTIDISKYEVFYSEVFHACVSMGTTKFAAPIWYGPVAFETFLFSLTIYRAWHDAKLISGSSAPILVVFYRDGMIAFLVMTGVQVWNICIYLTQPLSSIYVGTMIMWAVTTVLTTRVYVNLVSRIRHPIAVGYSTNAYGESAVEGDGSMAMVPRELESTEMRLFPLPKSDYDI